MPRSRPPTSDAVPAAAAAIEAAGYDGIFTFEGQHDPFFPLLLAGEHTERVKLTTAVAIAFARNPMTLAQIGVRPAARVARAVPARPRHPDQAAHREAVLDAVVAARRAHARAGARDPCDLGYLAHRRATRIPGRVLPAHVDDAVLQPGPSPYGLPTIFLAGVGPRMTEMAGEVADGFIVHPFWFRDDRCAS